MAKKSKEIKEEEEPAIVPNGYIGTVPKDMYWEWRTSIAELQTEKEKLETKKCQHKIMLSDVEISKLRSDIFAFKVKEQFEAVQTFQAELDSVRKKIEDHINAPLKGCIINEVFQVIKDEPAEEGTRAVN